jgi:HEPN domain-containing protein
MDDEGAPLEWLRFARSDLAIARVVPEADVLLETLCFHAQQAAEKALKAVLLHCRVEFPYTHNLGVLLDLLPPGTVIPEEVEECVVLTEYAVVTRYPGVHEDVTEEELRLAVGTAAAVLTWAEGLLGVDDVS